PDPAAPGLALVRITNPYAYPLLSRLRPTLDLTGGQGRHLAVPTPLVIAPGGYTFRVPLAGPPPDAATVWTPQAPAPGYLEMTTAPAGRP
ncbi:MAG: hypothetical protein M3010_03065, partial [Candidatus Dormibacteraeota bacterium]|nr:hypothetical protein [Candidatus Dormibacteraeota bacterium]